MCICYFFNFTIILYNSKFNNEYNLLQILKKYHIHILFTLF